MTATLVELVDGRVVTRDAEEWRAECMARHVLALPTLALRRAWIADFEKRHGPLDVANLMETMQLLHAKRKSK